MFRRYLRDADRDCAQYEVLFEQEDESLMQVIHEIAQTEEWGDIEIYLQDQLVLRTAHLNGTISYGMNDIPFLQHCGTMPVKKATAIDGWGRMDYKLYI